MSKHTLMFRNRPSRECVRNYLRRRYNFGKCRDCGNEYALGSAHCEECLSKRAQYARMRRHISKTPRERRLARRVRRIVRLVGALRRRLALRTFSA